MNKDLLVLVSIIFFSSISMGQKAPIKYGDVSLEDLKMTSYPNDTSAVAVVLCDYGFLDVNTLQFTRTLRIKILKKEGYNWANSSYSGNMRYQIKGVTSNLETGKIVQDRLKSESIFTDMVAKNNFIMRVAMPNIKVGSVIDLQFSFAGIPNEWKFQDLIPVKYSELVIGKTRLIGFRYNFFGFETLKVSTPTRWVAEDMPSFKEEPYLSSKKNYMTKLEFDILDIGVGTNSRQITTSWETISTLLMEDSNFGKALSGSLYLNNLAKTLENSKSTREDVLKMAYEEIKSIVKWDEKESVITSNPNLNFTFKMKLGNSADINLILLQLLKKLKFDVTPVVLSTRENGILSPVYPSIQRLNYVMVLAKIDDKSYLLDATEQFMPFYLIPFRCLNYQGRLINETESNMVDLGTSYKDKELTTYSLKMNKDNSVEGKLFSKRIDYSALNFRKEYHKFNGLSEYVENFKKDKQGLVINESKIYNVDSLYLPVIEEHSIKINNQLNTIGNEVYILPMFYNQLKENPFKMDNRKYPVDYGYTIVRSITSIIEIPDDFEVAELPKSENLNLFDNAASLSYLVVKSDNNIQVQSVFSINRTMFLPSEYNNLKEFYNQVIKKHSEPIILKRK